MIADENRTCVLCDYFVRILNLSREVYFVFRRTIADARKSRKRFLQRFHLSQLSICDLTGIIK